MTDSVTYSVVMSGDVRVGYEPEIVTNSFARLFKLTPEKASSIVGTRRVLKKGVNLKVAETYKQKLRGIGLEVVLEKHDPRVVNTAPEPSVAEAAKPQGLSLEPVEALVAESKIEAPIKPSIPNSMTCPKCSLEQVKSEECTGCGVFVSKVKPALPGASATEPSVASIARSTGDEDSYSEEEPSQLKVYSIPALAALLGALLWYFIAVSFEIELGLVAWVIGGAIGFFASVAGARGDKAGLVCATLLLLSIFGGKYMAMASFQSDWAEQMELMVAASTDDVRDSYEEELNDAAQFTKTVFSDDDLRKFMVNYDYSESYEEKGVTAAEISEFKEYTQPHLEQLYQEQPSLEEWRDNSVAAINDISTFDLMIKSLGFMDVLFLFLGVGTAFRLGRGEG